MATILLGCGSGGGGTPADPGENLRLNHIQAKGTHNSYHIAPNPFIIPDWDYTAAPLREQLESQGVRQFELDVHAMPEDDRLRVVHFPPFDVGTHCELFTDCLAQLKAWSDENPGHHTLVVLVEPKNGFRGDRVIDVEGPPESYVQRIDDELTSVWPDSRLVRPDDVRGTHPTLREAVLTGTAWPTIAASRGKLLAVLLDDGRHRDLYVKDRPNLEGRKMFVDADGALEQSFAAFVLLDDPVGRATEIDTAARAGFLIRTRTDGLSQARAGDRTSLLAAQASGAHFLSTDFPVAGIIPQYHAELPDGTPSRCNPVTAPPHCTAAAIERLGPR